MFYIETPKCPKCGSIRTGRVIYISNPKDESYVIKKSLKNGEFVKVKYGFKDSDSPNLFCTDCEIKWFGETKIKWISKQELKEIINLKNIPNLREHKKKYKKSKII